MTRFSEGWLACYADRRVLSHIDMLNCNDAFRGSVPIRHSISRAAYYDSLV